MASNVSIVIATKGAKDAANDIHEIGVKAEESGGRIGKLGGALGDIAKVAGGFVIGQGLLKLPGMMGSAISSASDLNESMSKVQMVFGSSAGGVEKWADTAAKGLGQSKQQALEAAGTFGNFLQAMGQGPAAAKDMSLSMVQLATDLASFNNANPEDVILALRSGLSGESEPMRKFGVALSEAAVSAKAAQMGIAPLGATLTEQQKITARYAIIMDQTKTAQGDFARTSDGLANKQRIQAAQMEDLSAKFGAMLLPIKILITDGFIKLIELGADLGEKVSGPVAGLASAAGELASLAWDKISGPLSDLTGLAWDGITAAGGALKDMALAAADLAGVAWDKISGPLADIANMGWDNLKAGIDSLKALAESKFDQVAPQFQSLSTAIKGIDMGTFASGWERVKDAIQPAVDVLKPLVQELLKALKDQFEQIGEALKPLGGALKDLVAAFAPLEPLLKPLGIVLGTVIVAALAALLVSLRLFTEFLTVTLVGAVTVATGIIKGITAAVDFVTDKVGAWAPELGHAFLSVWNTISANVGLIKDKLQEIWDKAIAVGSGIIDGLVSGINAGKEALLRAAKAMVGWIEDAIPDWIPHSPSKRGVQIGEGFGQGVIRGIENVASDVITTAGSLMKGLDAAVGRPAASIKNLGGNFSEIVQDITGRSVRDGGALDWPALLAANIYTGAAAEVAGVRNPQQGVYYQVLPAGGAVQNIHVTLAVDGAVLAQHIEQVRALAMS